MRGSLALWVAACMGGTGAGPGTGPIVHEARLELGPYKEGLLPVPIQWPLALPASELGAAGAGALRVRVIDVTTPASPVETPAALRLRQGAFDEAAFPVEAVWTLARPLEKNQSLKCRIVVERGPGAAATAPTPTDLKVSRQDKALTVENRFLAVRHAGPNMTLRVTFKCTGQEQVLAVRSDVYGPYGQGGVQESFPWKLDEPDGLRVIDEQPGAVRVVLAGAFRGSQPLPSRPRASFTFTYRPNLPLVRVDVHWQQDRPFDYKVVRLFQWGDSSKRFSTYVTGGKGQRQPPYTIGTRIGSVKAGDWMAVHNEQEMIGMGFRRYRQDLPINAFLYDGGKSFYLIANWTGRAGTCPTDVHMAFDLYIGPAGDQGDALARYAESLERTANAFYEYKIRELLEDI